MSPFVCLKNFVILRGNIPLFQPLTLEVMKGESISVIGENGAGKSTLLRALAGLYPPTMSFRGDCSVLSINGSGKTTNRYRAGVMSIRQIPTTYRGLTVAEQTFVSSTDSYSLLISVITRLNRELNSTTFKYIEAAIDEFGLKSKVNIPVAELSLGQRRALCFAAIRVRLEMGKLRLLLIDEPQSGIDSEHKVKLITLLNNAKKRGCAVIAAEHISTGEEPIGNSIVSLIRNGNIMND